MLDTDKIMQQAYKNFDESCDKIKTLMRDENILNNKCSTIVYALRDIEDNKDAIISIRNDIANLKRLLPK